MKTIWLDFANAPQVWVFSQVMARLKAKGYPLHLTARDFSYTVGLCRKLGYDVQVIGKQEAGSHKSVKALRELRRVYQVWAAMYKERKNIALAISHGSRAQMVAAYFLGIPVIALEDYEFSDQFGTRFLDALLVPFPISKEIYTGDAHKVYHYPGLKEELYLYGFTPPTEPMIPQNTHEKIKILFRGAGRTTHYQSTESQLLQDAILEHIAAQRNALLVLLPRDKVQTQEMIDFCKKRELAYWMPDKVVDGPALLWEMDMVFSGGGTMTREAATLGIPSYSFFAAQWGGVDQYLESVGRLVRVRSVDDVKKIVLKKRESAQISVSSRALDFVTDFIERAAAEKIPPNND